MATNSMVPYSNPGGRNQTTPGAGAPVAQPALGGTVPTSPTSTALNPIAAASSNPLVPTAGLPQATPATQTTDQSKQLTDIYGKGIGGDLNNLLNSIGGTDSATLQEYTASLVPQEATAKANLDASLGAGGVSANSSVAALGNANLQAQETAAIAGESAQLTQSGQNLEASILSGTEQAATAEVAESGWNVFGQVAQDLGGLAATTIGSGLL